MQDKLGIDIDRLIVMLKELFEINGWLENEKNKETINMDFSR